MLGKEEQANVLLANASFYSAFADADFEAMKEVWSKSGLVSVEHRGGPRIYGSEDVMRSWRPILRNPPAITHVVEDVFRVEDQFWVVCQEDLGPAVVRMVNAFQKEAGSWKMVYHGPAPQRVLNS